MGSDDGFTDPVNAGGSLFSDNLTGLTGDFWDLSLADSVEAVVGGLEAGKDKVLEWLTGTRTVPPPTTKPPELPNDPETCDKMLEAQQNIAIELALLNKNLPYFTKIHCLALLEISAAINQANALTNEKFPHREFWVAAMVDLQHHMRDGFDNITIRLAQIQEATNGVKVAGTDLPELKHTDPKKDKEVKSVVKRLLWKQLIKRVGMEGR